MALFLTGNNQDGEVAYTGLSTNNLPIHIINATLFIFKSGAPEKVEEGIPGPHAGFSSLYQRQISRRAYHTIYAYSMNK